MKISVAEYAKRRGVSKTAVQKAIKSGRIKAETLPNGRKMIDVDQADVDWVANTDPVQQQRGAPEQFAKTQMLAQKSAARKDNKSSPRQTEFTGSTLLDEKTRSERLRRRIAEIELAERERQTVSRVAIVAAWAAKVTATALLLNEMVDRVSTVIAMRRTRA